MHNPENSNYPNLYPLNDTFNEQCHSEYHFPIKSGQPRETYFYAQNKNICDRYIPPTAPYIEENTENKASPKKCEVCKLSFDEQTFITYPCSHKFHLSCCNDWLGPYLKSCKLCDLSSDKFFFKKDKFQINILEDSIKKKLRNRKVKKLDALKKNLKIDATDEYLINHKECWISHNITISTLISLDFDVYDLYTTFGIKSWKEFTDMKFILKELESEEMLNFSFASIFIIYDVSLKMLIEGFPLLKPEEISNMGRSAIFKLGMTIDNLIEMGFDRNSFLAMAFKSKLTFHFCLYIMGLNKRNFYRLGLTAIDIKAINWNPCDLYKFFNLTIKECLALGFDLEKEKK